MPRYTIDLDDDFDAQLTELAKQYKAGKKSDVIRDAIASYAALKQAAVGGRKISVTTDDDRVVKDIVLP